MFLQILIITAVYHIVLLGTFCSINKKQGQKLSISCNEVRRSESIVISGHNSMKELYLRDINIHTTFHQNRSINECARMILA